MFGPNGAIRDFDRAADAAHWAAIWAQARATVLLVAVESREGWAEYGYGLPSGAFARAGE
jgi:hypothetical protein